MDLYLYDKGSNKTSSEGEAMTAVAAAVPGVPESNGTAGSPWSGTGEHFHWTPLENLGKEGETYLQHILRHFPTPHRVGESRRSGSGGSGSGATHYLFSQVGVSSDGMG